MSADSAHSDVLFDESRSFFMQIKSLNDGSGNGKSNSRYKIMGRHNRCLESWGGVIVLLFIFI